MPHDLNPDAPPEVTLRLPGRWSDPRELADALPEGYRLETNRLHLPDGSSVEANALPPDNEFPKLFIDGCQRSPSEEDLRTIENYQVNFCLTGPGGSYDAAKRMLDAGAAVIRAGGAGVFVDNSGLSHPSEDWLDLADDEQDGGAYWAFVMTVGAEDEMYSSGAHVLGLRDAVVPRTGDDQADHFTLNNFLGYTYASGATIGDGDLLGDEDAAHFRVRMEPCTYLPEGSPLHNPYGRWRLEPMDA